MQDLRILVIDAPDAVAAVLAYYRVVACFDEGLYRVSNVAQVSTRTDNLDAAPHGFKARFGQALRVRRRFPDEVHAAGVAVKTFTDHRDIDVNDVTGLKPFVIGYAVADDVVNGGADRLREPPVIEVRRYGALDVDYVVVANAVELFGGHTGHDVLANHVEHLRGQPARSAHLFLFVGCLYRYMHGGAAGALG